MSCSNPSYFLRRNRSLCLATVVDSQNTPYFRACWNPSSLQDLVFCYTVSFIYSPLLWKMHCDCHYIYVQLYVLTYCYVFVNLQNIFHKLAKKSLQIKVDTYSCCPATLSVTPLLSKTLKIILNFFCIYIYVKRCAWGHLEHEKALCIPQLTEEREGPFPRVGLKTHDPPLQWQTPLHHCYLWPCKNQNLAGEEIKAFDFDQNLACGQSEHEGAKCPPEDTVDWGLDKPKIPEVRKFVDIFSGIVISCLYK